MRAFCGSSNKTHWDVRSDNRLVAPTSVSACIHYARAILGWYWSVDHAMQGFKWDSECSLQLRVAPFC